MADFNPLPMQGLFPGHVAGFLPNPHPFFPPGPQPDIRHRDWLPPDLQHPFIRNFDPKIADENEAFPPWPPDTRKPYKFGESRAAWIWPRDKHTKTPLKSWTRWKDVVSGKGPSLFVADRTRFSPTKDQWSNWLDYDNFGYQTGQADLRNPMRDNRKYDFNKRRYTNNPYRLGVWSGVRRSGIKGMGPTMTRDAWENEWTEDGGHVAPWAPWMNKYRFDPYTATWDYFKPTLNVAPQVMM